MRTALALSLVLLAAPAYASSNALSWTDNSDNETSFKVERVVVPTLAQCVATVTGFAQIGTTVTNGTSFTDPNVSEGTAYCYRVRASNSAGDSAYSNVAGRLVPFTVPAAPSGLGVVGGP